MSLTSAARRPATSPDRQRLTARTARRSGRALRRATVAVVLATTLVIGWSVAPGASDRGTDDAPAELTLLVVPYVVEPDTVEDLPPPSLVIERLAEVEGWLARNAGGGFDLRTDWAEPVTDPAVVRPRLDGRRLLDVVHRVNRYGYDGVLVVSPPGYLDGLDGVGERGVAHVEDVSFRTLAHELGHLLGLGHATAIDPLTADPVGPHRRVVYGDPDSVMGRGADDAALLHPAWRVDLGWLAADGVEVARSGRTHRVWADGVADTEGHRTAALVVDAFAHVRGHPLGRDLRLWVTLPATTDRRPGVRLHLTSVSSPGDVALLDPTPLEPGRSLGVGAAVTIGIGDTAVEIAVVDGDGPGGTLSWADVVVRPVTGD